MPSLSQSAVSPMRRPAWNDPRLVIGILLVVGSTVAGWLLFDRSSHTQPVFAATREIAAGQPIPADAIREVGVAGSLQSDLYLSPDSQPAGELVALRPVGKGELVPRASVTTEQSQDLRPIAVPLGPLAPTQLEPGDLVDLWLVPPEDQSGEPLQLAQALAVASVESPSSSFATTGEPRAEVLVPLETVPTLLKALASAGTVSMMRVPGS